MIFDLLKKRNSMQNDLKIDLIFVIEQVLV